MAFDELQQAHPACWGVPFRRHLQIKDRNIGLVKSRTTNGCLHVVCGHHVILVTQGPIELLSDNGIIINNQDSGLHSKNISYRRRLLLSKARTQEIYACFGRRVVLSVYSRGQKRQRGVYFRKHYRGGLMGFTGFGGVSSIGSSSSPTSSTTFNSAPNF